MNHYQLLSKACLFGMGACVVMMGHEAFELSSHHCPEATRMLADYFKDVLPCRSPSADGTALTSPMGGSLRAFGWSIGAAFFAGRYDTFDYLARQHDCQNDLFQQEQLRNHHRLMERERYEQDGLSR